MASAIRVEGMGRLLRANDMVERNVSGNLKDTLREAAQPVATTAQTLARQRIRRITVPWSQMRIGVTRRAVYVAPRQRRRNRSPLAARPKFGRLLIERAMKPALEQNQSQIQRQVDQMLSDLFDRWARLG